MTGDTMDLEIVLTPGLGNATYLVASGGEAVVVDPPRDAWRIEAVAARRGWRVTHVLETHVHNDYLSGALELRASAEAEIVAPARGRYAFAHRGVEEGDDVAVGDLRIVARATPGHTPEHLAWDVIDPAADRTGSTPTRPVAPVAVLTGGSLMVGSAGRTDLLGSAMTDELTAAQFRSLRSLASLPDDVAVLPTHGAGSFCSAGPTDSARTSTIGTERLHNPLFGARDEAVFRQTMLAGLAGYPTYYASMAPINRAGPAVLGRLPTPPALDPAGVRAALAAGATIVDARSRRPFAQGHLPGSLGIELKDDFASYVGWLVRFGTPLVLIMPRPAPDALVEATSQLIRIGFDRIIGWLDGGVEAWLADGGPLDHFPLETARTVRDEIAAGARPRLLDVRDPTELRDDGIVPSAAAIPLGELTARLDELPRDEPLTVLCKSGARASMAASVLDAAGFDVRVIGVGGAPDLAGGR
jgi:hydroxyacylglutathione hydrolase